MKQLFIVLFSLLFSPACHAHGGENFVTSDMTASMKPGDKAALLMVHFGTSFDETRTLTIDAINDKARTAFPELEVREAYTSRIVIRRLKERGIQKTNPLDALLKLRGDGFTHILVQSTHIIEGAEMESLRRNIAAVSPFFTEIRVGAPLLYSAEDGEALVTILENRKPEKGATVFVGHGTYTPATAVYAQLEHIMKARGNKEFYVGTVEGYPALETVLAQLKANKTKQATLVPLMFVAGDHAQNDIAGEWKEALEAAGLKVAVRMEALGQIPEVQDLFMEHARFSMHHKPVDIMQKKAHYATEEETGHH
ncbi:MAG: sirohydrochlorin cobaltochelatase [Culturomica sp.]|jgi:sirohydrochlorin cobaltochelatase|nr:sirohydrochlorin cobaltochelatase [Culturomica sp.]